MAPRKSNVSQISNATDDGGVSGGGGTPGGAVGTPAKEKEKEKENQKEKDKDKEKDQGVNIEVCFMSDPKRLAISCRFCSYVSAIWFLSRDEALHGALAHLPPFPLLSLRIRRREERKTLHNSISRSFPIDALNATGAIANVVTQWHLLG